MIAHWENAVYSPFCHTRVLISFQPPQVWADFAPTFCIIAAESSWDESALKWYSGKASGQSCHARTMHCPLTSSWNWPFKLIICSGHNIHAYLATYSVPITTDTESMEIIQVRHSPEEKECCWRFRLWDPTAWFPPNAHESKNSPHRKTLSLWWWNLPVSP